MGTVGSGYTNLVNNAHMQHSKEYSEAEGHMMRRTRLAHQKFCTVCYGIQAL